MLKRNKRLITAMVVATVITGTMATGANALTKDAVKKTLNTKLSLLDEMKAKKSYDGFRQLAEEIAQTINEANKTGAITNERANTLMEDLVKFSNAYNKHEYIQKHGKEILEKYNAEEAKRQADYMAKLGLGVTKPSNKDSETVKPVAKLEIKSNVVDKSALEKKLNDKIHAFNDMKSKKKYPNFRQFAEEFAIAITEANKAGAITNERANTLMEDLVKFSKAYNKHEYLQKHGKEILEKHNSEEAKRQADYMEKLGLGLTKKDAKKDSKENTIEGNKIDDGALSPIDPVVVDSKTTSTDLKKLSAKITSQTQELAKMKATNNMKNFRKFAEDFANSIYIANQTGVLDNAKATTLMKDLVDTADAYNKRSKSTTKPVVKSADTKKTLTTKEVKVVDDKKADKLVKTGSITTTEGLMAIGTMISAVGAFLMRRFRK